jgi:hypothetical protein
MSKIEHRALECHVNISLVTNTRKAKRVTQRGAEQCHAEERAFRSRKILWESKNYDKLVWTRGQIRNNVVGKYCKVWQPGVCTIVPLPLVSKFNSEFYKFRDVWEKHAPLFFAEYYDCKEKARVFLGDEFDESLYPPLSLVEAGCPSPTFRFAVIGTSTPDKERDIRLYLTDAQVEQIHRDKEEEDKRKAAEVKQRSVNEITERLARLSDGLKHYGEKTAKRSRSFNDSSVYLVQELAEIMPHFNFDNDPRIEQACSDILRKLSSLDPKHLKTEATQQERNAVAKDVDDILGTLEGAI